MLLRGHGRTWRAVERFIDGELAPADAPAVTTHLGRCPKCRQAALALLQIKEGLRRRARHGPPALAATRLRRFAATVTDPDPGAPWPTST